MVLNEKEIKAIDEKVMNPQKVVRCPRCGKKLIYKKYGNSFTVKCETENCLYDCGRGI